MKRDTEEELQWLSQTIDSELADAYNFSSSELYDQQAEAWRRYYRQPYGNEDNEGDLSKWVSPMIRTHTNDFRAFIKNTTFKNGKPILKFRALSPNDIDEAEDASDYVNHVFFNMMDGVTVADTLAFNAALLKIAPVRVRMETKKSTEELSFEYEGNSLDKFNDQLAMFFVANPELGEMDPKFTKETNLDDNDPEKPIYACYKWDSEEEIEKHPTVDIIPPGNFFVSRQSETLEDATLICTFHEMLLSDLAIQYPDAPELNGMKSKKEKKEFWESLLEGYTSWYSDQEWIAKWGYDSLTYSREQDEANVGDRGLGARRIFVIDAEVTVDINDSGTANLYHVVKVGNTVLHKAPISELSYMCDSLFKVGGKWLGLGMNDLVGMEAAEETINTRAFTDATVQAAHSNLIVDPDQVNIEDAENAGPDDIIRRKEGVISKSGVPAIEVIKSSGPDPSVLSAITHFGSVASQSTGVGASFSGASAGEISDMRMDKESLKVIDNKSTLLLNDAAHNFVNYIARIMMKMLNTGIKGNASPVTAQIANKWREMSPMNMRLRSNYIVTADIGSNDRQERLDSLNAGMTFLSGATGGGAPGPDGQPSPAIPVQLTAKAGYNLAKDYFEYWSIPNFESTVINPELPEGQEQVMSVIQQLQAQIPQMIQQGVQAALEQAAQLPESQKMIAETAKITAETDAIIDGSDEKAYGIANKLDAEERREDEGAMKVAVQQEDAETKKWKAEKEVELRERELAIAEAEVKKTPADKSNVTTLVNP